MNHIEIIVGSMLGATEYVADALQATLEQQGYQTRMHTQPNLDDIEKTGPWLICTSTHGAGDLPDNIQAFADQLQHQDLAGLNYLLVALGDSSYDTFCGAGATMQTLMQNAGASALLPMLEIDVLEHPIPEEPAEIWLKEWLNTGNKFE